MGSPISYVTISVAAAWCQNSSEGSVRPVFDWSKALVGSAQRTRRSPFNQPVSLTTKVDLNFEMFGLRSGHAIQRGIRSHILHPPSICRPAVAGSRTYSQPHAARNQAALRRALPCQSRAPYNRKTASPLAHPSEAHNRTRFTSITPGALRPGFPITHLQSRFPTKTAIFLLVVGGLVYYFVDVEEEDWTDGVQLSYQDDRSHSTPIHFNANKDDLDHYLQYHIIDPSAALKDPGVAKFLSDEFDRLAFGWMMTQEDAQRDNMPVTHGCRFRSNSPCEDFFSLGTSPGPGVNPWNYWSIFDGHAGRQCANQLQWTLIPYVSAALSDLAAFSSSPEVESTIKDTFLRVDKALMDSARTAANWFPAGNAAAVTALAPAFSGSCALLAAFDPEKDTLRVACTGDSRAVLGRWDPATGSYTSIPLSVDQTGFNEKEVVRLTQEHPDEPTMIDPKSGRLLGLAVTRAFGDHRWKWDNDFVKAMQCKFWGTAPRPNNKTPPYLTAEPEITETEVIRNKIGAGKSDFMIMASDGLWDRISSEHAVECVERWLEAKKRGEGSVKNDPRLKSHPPFFPSTFALEDGIDVDAENGKEIDWKATPEFFAIEDENAAVCLARNALGGTRRGLFTGILSISEPLCRYAVDDTTIMVVFFDKLDAQQGAPKTEEKKKSWWKPW